MKKILAILISLFLVVSFSFAGGSNFEIEKKLLKLQNSIVKNSFINLKPGAWASYKDGSKAIYVGEDTIDGMKLRGIELHIRNNLIVQIWYKVVPKHFAYNGENYKLLTLDPRVIFVQAGGMNIKLDYSQIQLIEQYYEVNDLSVILTPAKIYIDNNTNHKISIEETTVKVGSHAVKASVITSLDNGSKCFVSPEVPFGLIKTIPEGNPTLVNFSFAGASVSINKSIRANAKAFSFPIGF
ncbi:hypothetical protein [Thermotomaculum hydrothermale]|nr:hypothetical protein [Thermotomaculum hydrothermale]